MIFPCNYILLFKECEVGIVEDFLKQLIGTRLEVVEDKEFITFIYQPLKEDYVKEALEAFSMEGLFNIKAYCSNVINSAKEYEKEIVIMKDKLRKSPSAIYDSKELLLATSKGNVDKNVSEYVLKSYFFDEEMKRIINGVLDANLNVSKAAVNLYMHRNTLIYKLDKFKEITGYDIRVFRDASFINSLL